MDHDSLPQYANIPEMLEELQRRRRVSERRMSKEIGVANNNVSIWRSGERNPSPASCRKIARWAGLPEDYVLQLAGHRMEPVRDPDQVDFIPDLATAVRLYFPSPDEQRELARSIPLLRELFDPSDDEDPPSPEDPPRPTQYPRRRRPRPPQ